VTQLFERSWAIRVGPIDVSDLDCTFTVFKSRKREPNRATIAIYGLSTDTRQRIEGRTPPRVELRAGYGEDPPVLFVGDATRAGVVTEADGVDVVTKVEAKDQGDAYQRARLVRSFAAGATVDEVLRAAVRALGIGDGNLADFARGLALTNGATSFAEGYAAAGPARDVVDAIVRGAGLRWSIQNGVLAIRQRGQPIQNRATLLSPDTGLVGAPTADPKGVVTAVCLIQPGLDPGRRVVLESRQFQGGYAIRSVEYSGSTFGAEWYATLELEAY
jgi:hypothetical protein